MSSFAPKTYRSQVLDSIEAYFKACHELPSPSIAFTAATERLWGRGNAYNPLSGFPADMPYFCLRVPDGRFYPDFLCQLPGRDGERGPILAVEYKGADRWEAARDDRLIGSLWANLSEGHCRFVMVKDKRWEWIEPLLQ